MNDRGGIVETPLGQLRKARAARGAATRAKYARAGLAQSPEDAETRWLLMRQLYIAHLERKALDEAHKLALEMLHVFAEVQDVARFDLARVLMAKQAWAAAREQLILGRQAAPAARQWDHVFALARLEAALGEPERALSTVEVGSQSVVRLSRDPVVHAAVLSWKASAGRAPRRSSLGRAYERLSNLTPLPALGEFLGGVLLSTLGRPEAKAVFEEFLRGTLRLPAVARLSLSAEVYWTRRWLGKPTVMP